MPYYVELLRGLRAMRIVGVVLVVAVVGALWLRVSFAFPAAMSVDQMYGQMEQSPTAHVTRLRLPHGGTRTVVDDPKRQVYAVIDRDAHHDVTSVGTARSKADFQAGRGGATMVAKTRSSPAPGDAGDGVAFVPVPTALLLVIPCGLLMATL